MENTPTSLFAGLPYTPHGVAFALETAYGDLHIATQAVQKAHEELLVAHEDVRIQRDNILLTHAADPKALGANEAAREAKLRELTAEWITVETAASDALRHAQNRHTIAQNNVSAMRAQLRVIEAVAATAGIEYPKGGSYDAQGN